MVWYSPLLLLMTTDKSHWLLQMINQEIGETTAFQLMNATFSSFPLNQHLPRLPQGALCDERKRSKSFLILKFCFSAVVAAACSGTQMGEAVEVKVSIYITCWLLCCFLPNPFTDSIWSFHKLINIVEAGEHNKGDVHQLGRGELVDPGFRWRRSRLPGEQIYFF